MMQLQLILATLLETVLTTGAQAIGLVEEDQLHGLHAVRTSILWIFSFGNISAFYETPLGNVQVPRNHTVDACHTVQNSSGIFSRVQQSMQ
jgi:hypothetical protein